MILLLNSKQESPLLYIRFKFYIMEENGKHKKSINNFISLINLYANYQYRAFKNTKELLCLTIHLKILKRLINKDYLIYSNIWISYQNIKVSIQYYFYNFFKLHQSVKEYNPMILKEQVQINLIQLEVNKIQNIKKKNKQ